MLAILDPVLFDPRAPGSPRLFDAVITILRAKNARIPDVEWYWNHLQRTLIRPLTGQREYGRRLDRLREFAQTVPFPPLPATVTVWSMRQMFGVLGSDWVTIMSRVNPGAHGVMPRGIIGHVLPLAAGITGMCI